MGRIIFTSDWHLRPNHYPGRDVSALEMQKFLFSLFKDDDVIIIAGDVFDRWHVPVWYLNWVGSEITNRGLDVFAIFGNHDLPAGNLTELNKTALFGLDLMANVLPKNKIVDIHGYKIGFADFGEEEFFRDKELDFLVMHKMVFADKIPHWAVEAVTAQKLLNEFPKAKNIVVGDVHMPFIYSEVNKGIVSEIDTVCVDRHVINCGGVFREHESEQKFIYSLSPGTGILKAIPIKEPFGFSERVVFDSGKSEFSVIEELKNVDGVKLDFWSVFQKIGGKNIYEYARKLLDGGQNG